MALTKAETARLIARAKTQSEKDFQKTVAVPYLESHGWKVYEYGKPGARAKCPVCGTIVGMLAGAVPPGHVDIIAVKKVATWPHGILTHHTRIIWLELKKIGETLDPAQVIERNELLALRCEYYGPVSTLAEIERINES